MGWAGSWVGAGTGGVPNRWMDRETRESEVQGAGQREGTLKAEAGRDRGPKAENVGAQGLADRHPSALACLEEARPVLRCSHASF